ncbi:type IV pilin protein [Halocola ammonii]
MKQIVKRKLPALTLMELLVVLAIIGIIVMMVLPNFMGVVSDARSVEAQQQLKHVYTLQKTQFFKKAKYSSDLEELGFTQEKLASQGGNAYYEIEIVEASSSGFKAKATASQDFDGDGVLNVWTIDQDQNLKEVTKD